jgi:hypothetical protein
LYDFGSVDYPGPSCSLWEGSPACSATLQKHGRGCELATHPRATSSPARAATTARIRPRRRSRDIPRSRGCYGQRLAGQGEHRWEVSPVLYRPCAGLKEAALDPSLERMSERTVRLVWLLRKRFMSSEPRGSRGRSWHKRAGPQVSPPIDWPRFHLSRFHPLPGRRM